jgi:hypothetical protein
MYLNIAPLQLLFFSNEVFGMHDQDSLASLVSNMEYISEYIISFLFFLLPKLCSMAQGPESFTCQ